MYSWDTNSNLVQAGILFSLFRTELLTVEINEAVNEDTLELDFLYNNIPVNAYHF